MIEIYVDGSCKDNGAKENFGGFGVVVLSNNEVLQSDPRILYTYSKQVKNTTNNRMELSALLYALELTQVKYKQEKCVIKSDSAYCVNIFNNWIYNWNKNNWTRYKNQPIENLDLIKQIWEYCKLEWPNFDVVKVRGHDNILGNEIADALATASTIKLAKILKENEIEYEWESFFDIE